MSVFGRRFLGLVLSLVSCIAWAQVEENDPKKLEFQDISIAKPMLMAPMRDGVRLATDVYLPNPAKPEPNGLPIMMPPWVSNC